MNGIIGLIWNGYGGVCKGGNGGGGTEGVLAVPGVLSLTNLYTAMV